MPPQDKWPATFMVLTWLTTVAVTVLVSESLLNDLHLTGGQADRRTQEDPQTCVSECVMLRTRINANFVAAQK